MTKTTSVLLFLGMASIWADASGNVSRISEDTELSTQQGLQNPVPVAFIENRGQYADPMGKVLDGVLFRADAAGAVVFVTRWGLSYYFTKTENLAPGQNDGTNPEERFVKHTKMEWQRVDMELADANIRFASVLPSEPTPTHYNYYYPHCPQGIMDVRAYKHVIIKDIYPGIDWELIADGSSTMGFKTNFIVASGADYRQICMKINGPEGFDVQIKNNVLKVITGLGSLEETAPAAFSDGNNLSVRYMWDQDIGGKLRFSVSGYNSAAPLIIDPNQLIWSTYYGGSNFEYSASIFSDGLSLWVTGFTPSSNFPTYDPGGGAYYQGVIAGSNDAYILKFKTSTTERQWVTFYGGSGIDFGYSIHSGWGKLWIAGFTSSTDLPTLDPGGGAFYQATNAGGSYDAMVLEFDTTNLTLQWATYCGGTGDDRGWSIHSDATNVWMTGYTQSTDFPTVDPGGGAFYQGTFGGIDDAYILQFNAASRAMIWGTYDGGTGKDHGMSIESDGSSIWVCGYTLSSNFPTLDPGGSSYAQTFTANEDIFIQKYSPSGVLQWGTYYGGSGMDWGVSLHCDGTYLWVTGFTGSIDLPTFDPGGGAYFQGTGAGNWDAYILQFSIATLAREWATYYGGSAMEEWCDIDVSCNAIWVAGDTYSSDFPTLDPADGSFYQGTFAGGVEDNFLIKFDYGTRALSYGTYLGGTDHDETQYEPLSCDGSNVWVAGYTPSTDYPTLDPGGAAYFQGTMSGSLDAVLMKFSCSCPMPLAVVSGTTLLCNGDSSVLTAGGGSAYLWSNGDTTATITVSPASATAYYVTVSNSCGSDSDSIAITVSPVYSSLQNTTICQGDSIFVQGGWQTTSGTYADTLSTVSGCDSIITITLSVSPVYVQSINTGICQGDSVFIQSTWQNTSGTYYDTLITASGCDSIIVTTLTVNGVFNTNVSMSICQSDSIFLQNDWQNTTGVYYDTLVAIGGCDSTIATTLTVNPVSPSSYATSICLGDSIFLQGAWQTSSGDYYDTLLTVAGCDSIVQTTLTIDAQPSASISGNVSVCAGSSIQLTASGGNSYLWNTGDTTASLWIAPAMDTSYTVIVSNACGIDSAQQPISVLPSPTAAAGPDTSVEVGSTIQLYGTSGLYWLWSPAQDLSCSDCQNPVLTAAVTTTYYLTVTDINGCSAMDSLIVSVTDMTCGDVYVPNIFSPNGDGVNDVLYVYGKCLTDMHFVVYDRWGEMVFETTDVNTGWDGIFRGKMMNPAVFVFALTGTENSGKEVAVKGNVALVR